VGHMRKKMMDGNTRVLHPIKRHRVHNGEQPGFAQRALPRPLVEFFVKSFSDAGDAILDPLCYGQHNGSSVALMVMGLAG